MLLKTAHCKIQVIICKRTQTVKSRSQLCIISLRIESIRSSPLESLENILPSRFVSERGKSGNNHSIQSQIIYKDPAVQICIGTRQIRTYHFLFDHNLLGNHIITCIICPHSKYSQPKNPQSKGQKTEENNSHCLFFVPRYAGFDLALHSCDPEPIL